MTPASGSVTPVSGPGVCQRTGGRAVTVDGDHGYLVVHGKPGDDSQELCFNDVQGMTVNVSLDPNLRNTSTLVPGASTLGGAIEVFRHLRLLGTNPANWTADPVLHS